MFERVKWQSFAEAKANFTEWVSRIWRPTRHVIIGDLAYDSFQAIVQFHWNIDQKKILNSIIRHRHTSVLNCPLNCGWSDAINLIINLDRPINFVGCSYSLMFTAVYTACILFIVMFSCLCFFLIFLLVLPFIWWNKVNILIVISRNLSSDSQNLTKDCNTWTEAASKIMSSAYKNIAVQLAPISNQCWICSQA